MAQGWWLVYHDSVVGRNRRMRTSFLFGVLVANIACIEVPNVQPMASTGDTSTATTDLTDSTETSSCTPGYPGCSCIDGLCLAGFVCVDDICEEDTSTTEPTDTDTGTETGMECIPGQELCTCDQGTCDDGLICGPEDTCLPTTAESEILQASANAPIIARIAAAQELSWPTGPAVAGLRLPFDNPLHLGISATTGCGAHQGVLTNGVDFSLYGNLESHFNVRAVAAAAGNYVLLRHADETYTLYAHLGVVDVQLDDIVCAGEVLGTIGMTGDVTGELLHFEYRDSNGDLLVPNFEEIANLPNSCDYYCGTADPTEGCLASVNGELCTFGVIEDVDDLLFRLISSDANDVWLIKPGDYVLDDYAIMTPGVFMGQPGVTIDLADAWSLWLRDGDAARFENLTFVNGGAFWDDDGGAFRVTNQGALDLYKVSILDSFAQEGGALWITDQASVTGEQVVISGCSTTSVGGAIALR
jgi:murein DD-endopeptidase MepM/ murein hydrolase activator NlpD